MTKIICPEPGSQLTIGSVTAPMTEPTLRTKALRDKWESIYLDNGGVLTHKERDAAFTEAMTLSDTFERSLALKEALLREIHAALGWRQKNMKERIERELEGKS
jgi:hypothetical protein